MEKSQSELCFEILRRFRKAGILDDLILIGSWCGYFYKEYFSGHYIGQIKTRDIDFLIGNPSSIRKTVDIPELLKDLGYVTIYKGSEGYVKLDHPELLLEFLVPERGKGTDKPHPLPKLGVNAVALRFLDFLTTKTIKVKIEDFYLTVPHPANFALHKLIISQRRLREDKASKDRNMATDILKVMIRRGEAEIISQIFYSVPKKWQSKIIKGLDEVSDKEVLSILR